MKKIKINTILCGVSLFLLSCGGGENNPITKAKKAMKQASEVVDVVKKVGDSQSILQESGSRMQELQDILRCQKKRLRTDYQQVLTNLNVNLILLETRY